MTYGTRDLLTEERNAWQRGDYELADALALAFDAEKSESRAQDLHCVLDDIHTAITESNWRTGTKGDLRKLVRRISDTLKGAP